MLLFVAANDLLTMFVALEVFSLPLYLLCALARRRRLLSQEAALKYFLLGSYASAFFLFGVALIYGFAGGIQLGQVHAAVANPQRSQVLLYAGLALVAIGLLFKSALAPFHVWTPDVYQGAPTPVTALMAACTKTAAFGALLRVLYVAFEGVRWDFQPVLGVIAVLTMLVGAVLAVTQTDMKRLLAYSSIANAGYILVGVLALNKEGLSSTMFYLVAYGFSVLAAFGIVTLVRDADGEATHLSRWAGLGRKSPLFAGVFTFILLAFAGIPLTSGFTSKFAVFGAAIQGGQTWLVIFGVISSMLIAFPYLRVVVMLWLSEPGESTPTVSIPGFLTSAALGDRRDRHVRAGRGAVPADRPDPGRGPVRPLTGLTTALLAYLAKAPALGRSLRGLLFAVFPFGRRCAGRPGPGRQAVFRDDRGSGRWFGSGRPGIPFCGGRFLRFRPVGLAFLASLTVVPPLVASSGRAPAWWLEPVCSGAAADVTLLPGLSRLRVRRSSLPRVIRVGRHGVR